MIDYLIGLVLGFIIGAAVILSIAAVNDPGTKDKR